LVAKDKIQNPITSCIFQNGCLHVREKCSSQKNGEKCQLDPGFVGGFGGRGACASSEQVFFGCDKKSAVDGRICGPDNCPWPHHQIVAADQKKMEAVGSIELPSLAKLES
jgi:hypothetical protein